MAFDIDIIKKELMELEVRQFYTKYIVKTENWYFSTFMNFDDGAMLEAVDRFKEIVSEKLSINFHSAHIVGSAKLGYSLSPRKPFSPFKETGTNSSKPSDIDIAIISDKLFNKFWQHLRQAFKPQQKKYYTRLSYTIFRGYIDEDDISSIAVVYNEWNNLFSPITRSLQDEWSIVHKITYRLYRSWEDLEQYQIHGLNQLKRNGDKLHDN